MANTPRSNGNDGRPRDESLEVPTLSDVWPTSHQGAGPEFNSADSEPRRPRKAQKVESKSQSMLDSLAPRNYAAQLPRRRPVLNAIEPSRVQRPVPESVLSRAARYERQQSERYADEERPFLQPYDLGPPAIGAAPVRPSAPGVPDEFQTRYVRQARDWYSKDGRLAFSVRRDRFTTPRDDRQIVQDLVLAAQSNGWSEVTVTGTERWRRRAWREASLVGLQVRGYEPSAKERQQLIRDIAEQSALLDAAKQDPGDAQPDRGGVAHASDLRRTATERELSPRSSRRRMSIDTMAGRLVDHGAAPYRFKDDESLSYYAKILTPEGERTYWGVGLKKAIEQSESKIKIGDNVAMRRVGKEPVTVSVEQRDSGGSVQKMSIDTERVEWRVESPEWFATRAKHARVLRDDRLEAVRAAREDPELARSMMSLRAGELLAEQRMSSPKEREKFNSAVAARLQREAERGEAAPAVKVRPKTTHQARENGRGIEPRAQDLEHSR